MAKSPNLLLVVGLAVVGTGAAGALFLNQGAPPSGSTDELRAELASVTGELDSRLRETAAGVHARAVTLAELPRLQAAVSTDAATVADLTQDELAFRTKPGETIVIGQIPKGGKPLTLFKSAAESGDGSSVTPPLDQPGYHLSVAGGVLVLSEVVDVRPRDRADELRGAIALSRLVDVTTIVARINARGLGARLDVDGQKLPLGGTAIPDGAATTSLPLQSEMGKGVQLVAQAKTAGPAGHPLRGAAVGVELLTLIGAALLLRRGSGAAGDKTRRVGSSAPTTRPGNDGNAANSGSGAVTAGGLPQQIGRYEVIRQLGSGGMAEVYLARSTGEAGFEKLVALKVMHRNLAQQTVLVEHFLDEARLASRLTHPNIVQISDLGKADDEYFIAMEFIDGSDLEKLLYLCRSRGEMVPARVALAIIRKILGGLHAAHVAVGSDGKPLELVHRDVKSANVFIAKNGAVKVGDFGIAKANHASRVNMTRIGEVKGTAAYMAPEHRTGQAVDRRADLYSAGAIAWELFTGNEINLDLEVLAHLGKVGWPHLMPPSQVRADLPPELDAVVFKALAYDRDDRYPTCLAFEEALEDIANRHGLTVGDRAIAQWAEEQLAAAAAAEPAAAAR